MLVRKQNNHGRASRVMSIYFFSDVLEEPFCRCGIVAAVAWNLPLLMLLKNQDK